MNKLPRPGIVATKAVNQYRKRDAFAYLGLRQLLKGAVARSDDWAIKVAVDQVIRRSSPSYYVVEHFKELGANGINKFRKIVVPGPVEILAESALLTECSRHSSLAPHNSAFTYHLAEASDRSGIFKNYMVGLRARHRAIESACLKNQNASVRFLDIKRFYPSISEELVSTAWRRNAGTLPERYQALGATLIRDHSAFSVDGSRSLLTGPMFSHFGANLVMRDFDEWAATSLGVEYFRYVDDITLVGERSQIRAASLRITERLKAMELELHDENSSKSIEVNASDWMIGKSDFEHDFGDLTWGSFVFDLKNFLTLNPESAEDLASAFADSGARLPVLDYAAAIREATYAESFYARARRTMFRLTASALTVDSIAKKARQLKERMEAELNPLLDELASSTGFRRKRLIPKLRFRIGRLAYLSEEGVLKSFGEAVAGVDELALQREVIGATVSGSLKALVAMGANAVQAASQPLVAGGKEVSFSLKRMSEVEAQGVAAAVLSGVRFFEDRGQFTDRGILDLSRGVGVVDLRRSDSQFISEVAFLADKEGGHLDLLSEAFDEDEQLVFDAVERFDESAPTVV